MKKYRVFVKSIEYLYLDVEAKNKDKAFTIAQYTDGGDFIETGNYDWLIDEIKEIKNESN